MVASLHRGAQLSSHGTASPQRRQRSRRSRGSTRNLDQDPLDGLHEEPVAIFGEHLGGAQLPGSRYIAQAPHARRALVTSTHLRSRSRRSQPRRAEVLSYRNVATRPASIRVLRRHARPSSSNDAAPQAGRPPVGSSTSVEPPPAATARPGGSAKARLHSNTISPDKDRAEQATTARSHGVRTRRGGGRNGVWVGSEQPDSTPRPASLDAFDGTSSGRCSADGVAISKPGCPQPSPATATAAR